MVLKHVIKEKVVTRPYALAIVAALAALAFSACDNALTIEVEALRREAIAQTKIPVAPGTPSATAVGGPTGSGKVLLAWEAVPGTSSYDVYYSSTVSPPAMPNGGSSLPGLSCVIEGLNNWENYYFWIIAKNKLGSSPLSVPPAVGSAGIRVSSITLSKAAATFLPGSQESLIATCLPANATFPTVTWSSNNESAATVANGTVTGGSSAGVATISATVADGSPERPIPSTSFVATNKLFALNTAGPAGGYLFYDKGSYSNGWRYMEAAPEYVGDGDDWRNLGPIIIPGAWGVDFGTGKTNSAAIMAAQGVGTYMAMVCQNYSHDGYGDWFMPSEGEANQLIFRNPPPYVATINLFVSSTQVNNGGGDACRVYRCYAPLGWFDSVTYFNDTKVVTRPIRQF